MGTVGAESSQTHQHEARDSQRDDIPFKQLLPTRLTELGIYGLSAQRGTGTR